MEPLHDTVQISALQCSAVRRVPRNYLSSEGRNSERKAANVTLPLRVDTHHLGAFGSNVTGQVQITGGEYNVMTGLSLHKENEQ